MASTAPTVIVTCIQLGWSGYPLEMHSVRTGAGKPLLLVHGISNLRNWDLVVPALARERMVVAVDLPGFGESPPPVR